jgi:hypothetical protein
MAWTPLGGRAMLRAMGESQPPPHLRVVTHGEHGDPYVMRALAAMKADPSRQWTVAALGRVAGLSRAASPVASPRRWALHRCDGSPSIASFSRGGA